jgi:hypothetical protein
MREDILSGSQKSLNLRVGFGNEFDDQPTANLAHEFGDFIKGQVV